MTDQEIRKLLFTINSIYPNFKVERPEDTVKIWIEFLGDQNTGAILASLKNYVRNNTTGFAPSIGQLIQGAYDLQNRNELTPAEAWSKVYKAICRSTYFADEEFEKLPQEVQKAVGSPDQLRAWASSDQFNESVASSNFRKAYATVCERKREDASLSDDVRALIESKGIGMLEVS